MNIHRAIFSEANALYAKGARWLCVAAYDHSGFTRGDVISWHKTHERAARAAGSSPYRRAVEVDYVETIDLGTHYLAAKLAGANIQGREPT